MYLIDTDIIIYSLKGVVAVNNKMEEFASSPKAISAITYGELCFGAAKSRQKTKNMATVKRVAELFPVININVGIMDIFGEIKADLQNKGLTIDDFDLLNASTAMYLNYTLVTNNIRHYQPVKGIRVENWSKE